MTIGENIKTIRKQKGLTQKEVAATLGISDSGMGQWETGRRIPGFSTLERIAALDVSVSELIDGATVSETPRKPKLKVYLDLSPFDIDSFTALKLEDNAFTVSGIMENGCQVSYRMGADEAQKKGIVSFENE